MHVTFMQSSRTGEGLIVFVNSVPVSLPKVLSSALQTRAKNPVAGFPVMHILQAIRSCAGGDKKKYILLVSVSDDGRQSLCTRKTPLFTCVLIRFVDVWCFYKSQAAARAQKCIILTRSSAEEIAVRFRGAAC